MYTDKAHHHLLGAEAYKAALNDGYFDLVELSFSYNNPLARYIRSILEKNHHYALIAKTVQRDEYSTNYFWVWSKISMESPSS
jgi:hypothetical protein